jgi:pimeloyl-ACP methyl ester carboxylesterase
MVRLTFLKPRRETIMLWRRTLWLAVFIVISGSLTLQAWAAESLQTRQLHVNGVDLSYLDQGTGAPVVFVHGAFLDLRFWQPQRQAIAQQYRFIAYTSRYHGTAAWPDTGKDYSAATHAADLAAFLRQLNAGPVHLVGHSYGGLLATLVAVEHPELLRSLTLAEPGIGALLTDIP